MFALTLPKELKETFAISDGVGVRMQTPEREEEIGDFLWTAGSIQEEGIFLPTGFLFFADAGNGDCFGFTVSTGGCCHGPIVVYDHETQEVRPCVISFQEFVWKWGSGDLRI